MELTEPLMQKYYTKSEVILILMEFLNFTSESVPEQQGGYDFENERWISGTEMIETFVINRLKW
ncbi:hypothetical protein RI092_12325 [Lactococcus cremoris]|uniref:hypothetical protein n=1 Tax=Lactococcus lactis subsp. cremoris TaxID=1359 RepID=UPI002871D7E8|nr:hypothetical protein [Lactococcus cremoris]MDR9868553.1 hypothetical protein [Lactococcus cremoris]